MEVTCFSTKRERKGNEEKVELPGFLLSPSSCFVSTSKRYKQGLRVPSRLPRLDFFTFFLLQLLFLFFLCFVSVFSGQSMKRHSCMTLTQMYNVHIKCLERVETLILHHISLTINYAGVRWGDYDHWETAAKLYKGLLWKRQTHYQNESMSYTSFFRAVIAVIIIIAIVKALILSIKAIWFHHKIFWPTFHSFYHFLHFVPSPLFLKKVWSFSSHEPKKKKKTEWKPLKSCSLAGSRRNAQCCLNRLNIYSFYSIGSFLF